MKETLCLDEASRIYIFVFWCNASSKFFASTWLPRSRGFQWRASRRFPAELAMMMEWNGMALQAARQKSIVKLLSFARCLFCAACFGERERERERERETIWHMK